AHASRSRRQHRGAARNCWLERRARTHPRAVVLSKHRLLPRVSARAAGAALSAGGRLVLVARTHVAQARVEPRQRETILLCCRQKSDPLDGAGDTVPPMWFGNARTSRNTQAAAAS